MSQRSIGMGCDLQNVYQSYWLGRFTAIELTQIVETKSERRNMWPISALALLAMQTMSVSYWSTITLCTRNRLIERQSTTSCIVKKYLPRYDNYHSSSLPGFKSTGTCRHEIKYILLAGSTRPHIYFWHVSTRSHTLCSPVSISKKPRTSQSIHSSFSFR